MTSVEHGMIAVDKMGTRVLFLNPLTHTTEVVIDGFLKTVHELLVVPETGFAYVPIFAMAFMAAIRIRSIISACSTCTGARYPPQSIHRPISPHIR